MSEEEKINQKGLISRFKTEFDFIQGNFLLLIISWFIVDFFAELPMTYFPLFVTALGGTATSLGIIMASMMITMGLVQITGGYIADKYGRKWIIVSMTVISGFGRLIYVIAPTWEWLILAAAIMGFTLIYVPALEAMVADSIPSEKRGIGFGIVHLISSVSTTPSPLIAGYLFLKIGLVSTVRLCFGLASVGFLAAALIRTRLTETVESPEKINFREIVQSYPTSIIESVKVWKQVPSDAFSLFSSFVLTWFSFGLVMPISTLYMIDDIGITELELSVILSAMFVTMIIFALPTGKLVDIIGKKKPLLIGYLIWGVSVPLFIFGSFWRLILAMTLRGALRVLIGSAGSAWMADLVPIDNRGKVNGSSAFFSLVALSIGQLLGGWLYDNLGHSSPLLIQVAFMIPPFLIIMLKTKEQQIDNPDLDT
jgi:MFS family permease